MHSSDQPSDTDSLETRLKLMTETFDQAIKKDVELSELKRIFHEMKSLKIQLENLNPLHAAISKNGSKNS
jgi:hypothetical protein